MKSDRSHAYQVEWNRSQSVPAQATGNPLGTTPVGMPAIPPRGDLSLHWEIALAGDVHGV
jgi:hypothetical protein